MSERPVVLHGPTKMATDAELIEAIARRHTRAMELLFGRHSVQIYRFVVRLTGDVSLAEDVVSEVFLDVWRGAGKFRASSRVSTWLFAIARNKAISALRHKTERGIVDVPSPSLIEESNTESSVDHWSRSDLIRRCLLQLPSAQREILDLVYYHEKSIAEVAMIVGIPSGTVKTRMFRARGRMATLLKGAGVNDLQMI